MKTCPVCGQPLPNSERKDPPLPPLDFPAVVTIHDLPAGSSPQVTIDVSPAGAQVRRLVS